MLAALSIPFLLVALGAIAAAVLLAVLYASRGRRIRDRLQAEHETQFEPLTSLPDDDMWWLPRWLYVSGFRRRGAEGAFLASAGAALLVGILLAVTVRASTQLFEARTWLYDMPGNIGALMDPVLVLMPWFLLVMVAFIPWMVVRSARRRRIQEIEEDLPISLQLLATLSRAGLGFDSALAKVIESGDAERTLTQELMTFRRENVSGIPRLQCWHRLKRRVEVPSISMFVSAITHAEQVGGGIADVLGHQTEDVQSRRRERALIAAQGLQVKLVFPLVICFLPGIFVWTLGPAFYQFLQVLDGVMRDAGSL